MKTAHFVGHLLNDAVISERTATTGGHRSLDHIPGGCLLGAAAARLYDHLGNDAFTVFHSGKVRFGNAYPLSATGQRTLPVPLAWHAPKGEELHGSVAGVKNLVRATEQHFQAWDEQGDQQKQLRSGFFSPDGELVNAGKRYRLKTAVDRHRLGMSEERQLFGYESLAAGSLWHFCIDFDDTVSTEVVDQVTKALHGQIRVGRSRSAEYGLLQTTRVEVQDHHQTFGAGGEIVLYCASDLALADNVTAAPVLTPAGDHFGLSGVTFLAEKSYLRVRSYAPFNSTRRHFDLERQVIAKGSVLVFRAAPATTVDLPALVARLKRGIGLYRQEGLGQVLLNPGFLESFQYASGATGPALEVPQLKTGVESPELTAWLNEKLAQRDQEVAAIAEVDGWIAALVGQNCPKNSQWGRLRTIALVGNTLAEIRAEIKQLTLEGVSQKQWGKTFVLNGRKVSYGDFLEKTVLAESIDLETARRRLYLLGNRLPRKANQANGGTL